MLLALRTRVCGLYHRDELFAARPGVIEQFVLLFTARLFLCGSRDARSFGESGKHTNNGRVENSAQRIVDRPQLKVYESVFNAGNTAPSELIAQLVPSLFCSRTKFAPIEENVALIGVQR